MNWKIAISMIIGLILLCLFVMGMLVSAHAQTFCGKSKQLVAALSNRYSEGPVASGMLADGKTLLAMFGNAKTGTWTIFVVSGDGSACVFASGDGMKVEVPGNPL